MLTITVFNERSHGVGSLAEAIETANATPGADRIVFDDSVTMVTLDAALPLITEDLVIIGNRDDAGAPAVIIDANADGDDDASTAVASGAALVEARRVFEIDRFVTAGFEDIVVTGGAVEDDGGGGIWAHRGTTVTLTNSIVERNVTFGPNDSGGGILADQLYVEGSIVRDNATTGFGSTGGGIAAVYLEMRDSEVSGNKTAGVRAAGGGVSAQVADIESSLISHNATTGLIGWGGGLSVDVLTLTNSTVANNSTAAFGAIGGGFITGIGDIVHSTITANSTAGEQADGGGVAIRNKGGSTFTNSIFVGNVAAAGEGDDLYVPAGLDEVGSNLVGGDAALVFAEVAEILLDRDGDGIGDTPTGVFGGVLGDNGGPTPTVLILADGPAANAAVELLDPVLVDQRGIGRPQGPGADLGALELAPPGESSIRGELLHALNVGGGAIQGFADTPDGKPIDFAADDGAFLVSGGSRVYFNEELGGTASLLGSERFSPGWDAPMAWQLPVEPGGKVVVDLYFGEIYPRFLDTAARTFNVSLEGEKVLEEFDILAEAGFGNLLVKTFTTTVGEDGLLDLSLERGLANNPKIAGVAVYLAASGGELPDDENGPDGEFGLDLGIDLGLDPGEGGGGTDVTTIGGDIVTGDDLIL
jgi:hypothetical protein